MQTATYFLAEMLQGHFSMLTTVQMTLENGDLALVHRMEDLDIGQTLLMSFITVIKKVREKVLLLLGVT